MAEIGVALSQTDRAALAKAAHKLKGACANIHAHALQSLAGRLEIDSVAAEMRSLEQGYALLRREFDRVKAFLSDPAVIPHAAKAAS